MAQIPERCGDCMWFFMATSGRPECRRFPPAAAPAHDAPILFEYPRVDPNNLNVCGEALIK